MKARFLSLIFGLIGLGHVSLAQNTVYRMHVKLQNGSTYTVKADDVEEVYFTASQAYDPTNPVTADVTSIHAPKDGGTYTVHVNSNIPLTTESGAPNNISIVSIFDNFLNSSTVNLTYNYNDGVLTIIVNPTTNHIVKERTVKLYDYEGTEAFSIIVSQDSDPNAPLLSDIAIAYMTSMAQMMVTSHTKYRMADAKYTGLIENDDFKAPIDPYDYHLLELWSALWQGISYNTQLMQDCNGNNMEMFLPMCYVLNALSYYELVTLFGGVPYYTNLDEMLNDYLRRTDSDEILSNLTGLLTSVIGNLDEEVTGYIEDVEKLMSPSKDVIRTILADIYMYQGKYAEAQNLLSEIVSGNRYSLVPTLNNLDINCTEIIWSLPSYTQTRARAIKKTDIVINTDLCVIKTYSDVLLSLAECESKLGNEAKAREYLAQVTTTKSIETTSSEVIPAISEARSKIQIDFGGYFAFLKRTGLALDILGIEEYQLLFPIPQNEVNINPTMTQNPGY